jgi:hypothetical protein
MMNFRIVKILAGFAVLFGLGGLCGSAVSTRPAAIAARQARWEEHWVQKRMQEDADRLRLTPEQVEKARPLYDQMLADFHSVREEATRNLVQATVKQGRALWPELTPDQQKEFEGLSEERRARWLAHH